MEVRRELYQLVCLHGLVGGCVFNGGQGAPGDVRAGCLLWAARALVGNEPLPVMCALP